MVNTSSHTHNTFSRWMISHVRAIQFAAREFIRAPIANFFTICVIAIAIALPLGFFVLLENLQYADNMWEINSPSISLFLKTDITQSQVDALMQQLRNTSSIKNAKYVSPDEGLKSFEKNTPFGDAVKLFQKNPIPGVITIFPASANQNPEKINVLYQSLKQLPSVDVAQIDMDWITRLFDIIAIGKKITKALFILFAFGVVLIIGHSLRASLSAHTKEIQVMKLMGATNAYIKRPLIYRGALVGLLGGVLAWILITIFIAQLQRPVTLLAKTYNTFFQLQSVSLTLGGIILFASGLLGVISAWLIITQFLNEPEQID